MSSSLPESQVNLFESLVGLTYREANAKVTDMPNVRFVPSNGMITADYNPDRYWIVYDPETGIVESVDNG